jgi:hypothetical protein
VNPSFNPFVLAVPVGNDHGVVRLAGDQGEFFELSFGFYPSLLIAGGFDEIPARARKGWRYSTSFGIIGGAPVARSSRAEDAFPLRKGRAQNDLMEDRSIDASWTSTKSAGELEMTGALEASTRWRIPLNGNELKSHSPVPSWADGACPAGDIPSAARMLRVGRPSSPTITCTHQSTVALSQKRASASSCSKNARGSTSAMN